MVAVFCWRLLAVRLPSSQFDESDWTRGGAAVNTSNLSKQTHELQATAIACVFTRLPDPVARVWERRVQREEARVEVLRTRDKQQLKEAQPLCWASVQLLLLAPATIDTRNLS